VLTIFEKKMKQPACIWRHKIAELNSFYFKEMLDLSMKNYFEINHS